MVVGGRVCHERLGFELDLPGSGWTITPQSPFGAADTPWVAAYTATSPDGAITLMGLHIEGADEAFLNGLIEQGFFGGMTKDHGAPERQNAKLAGHSATRLVSKKAKMDAVIGHAGATHFVIAIEATKNSKLDADAVYAGFKLLD